MTDKAVEDWFAAVPEDQKAALNELRGMVKSLGPNVVEEFKWGRPCYSTARGLFCYFQSSRSHAAIGFQEGASLDDPRRLLQGSGKNMRHIKLGATTELDRPALLALLGQAWSKVS